VGAIAVLFLFVVMMLNVKSTTINSNFFFLAIITLMLLLLNIFLLIDKVFTDNFFVNTNTTTVIDVLTNIEIFGQLLYNYNIYLVLIAGFLLLIALVGSISISIKRNF
jgi:NADH-quinone oxidoreductase subunit J